VIPTLQAGSISGCLVIVSGWKEGIPLPEYLEKEEIGFESALAMIDCLAKAFEIYHAAGWVHGHLRAESVIVTSTNEVTLAGHGFLDVVTGYVPEPLDPNRVYIAPERNGRESEPSTIGQDVYTVGVVAYEILTGDKPTGQFMKLPSQVTGTGNWLDDVILRSIHSKSDSRIKRLTEFRSEMAAQTLLLMDLSKKDKEEAAMPRGSKEVSGSTAMLKKPLYILMVFSLLMVGIALWLG
jgi:serine/threonine protein kinase